MPPRKKFQSKRVTTRQRVKIEKKVRAHHRKMRRETKKKPQSFKSKKDPGVPNAFPMKDDLLKQFQEAHEKEKFLKKQRLGEMLAAAQDRNEAFESKSMEQENKNMNQCDNETKSDHSRKSFNHDLMKVIESSDVLLQILDARDPLGCRCSQIEGQIIEAKKRLVLILNKADLIPKPVLDGWVSYLKQYFPVIPFSTMRNKASTFNSLNCSGDDLIQLLKNYSRSLNVKTAITVGLIGYPNVGKSSIINSLKRSKVCQVGATPGVTRSKQQVHLDKNLRLLDCPGIVFSSPSSSSNDNDNDNLLLRNCLKVEKLSDPVGIIGKILDKCPMETLKEVYGISSLENVNKETFLSSVAVKQGKLLKGGRANLEEAAKVIIRDWNYGKIPYYTLPPSQDVEMEGGGNSFSLSTEFQEAKIVTSLAPEFSIN